MPRQPGNDHSVCISGDETDKMRGYWAALSNGAEIQMPLAKQMWGDEYGSLTDRFGVLWMVNITPA